MILLVAAAEKRKECAVALQMETGEEIAVAEDWSQAITMLRSHSYRAMVFDVHLPEVEPQEIDTAFQHLELAVPIQANLATMSMERFRSEVCAALRRRAVEEAGARESAVRDLRGNLNTTLTALLLRCDQLLKTVGLPNATADNLISIQHSAEELRAQLERG